MVRNYAQFGLFANGKMIQSGIISELESVAISLAEKHAKQYYFVGSINFDIFDEPILGTKVLSIYNDEKDIVIMNELL